MQQHSKKGKFDFALQILDPDKWKKKVAHFPKKNTYDACEWRKKI